MSGILLAKPILPPDFLDVSVGEPHLIRENLLKIFSVGLANLPSPNHCWEYPNPIGYAPLVKLLEDKYQAPVIITNGAKQALGASFYALKKMGKQTVGMRSPYWTLIPPLVEMHGLSSVFSFDADANLLLMPNNPDGFTLSPTELKEFGNQCKEKNIPLIHDAAYYSHIYLPYSYPLDPVGDVQIFSISKMLGLSGLRLGFAVCHNSEFYKYIQEYMEHMTVGVSIVPQLYLTELLTRMNAYPTLVKQFEGQSSLDLERNKKIIKQIKPEILEIDSNLEKMPGMFLWAKCKKPEAFTAAKINVVYGDNFGMPGYVRMNLAFDEKMIQDIVNRLNNAI